VRIISGEFRRRKLTGPPDAETTRPIPDRVKQSLFNLLRGYTEGAHVFDAFAGTGAIGLEAVSRGATRCVFIERDKKIGEVLQRNIDHLGVRDRVELVRADALGPLALARCPDPVDLVFLDPPYPLVRDEDSWLRVRAQAEALVAKLSDEGWMTLRTPWPFVHRPEPVSSAPAPVTEVVEIDLSDEGALDELDAFEAELARAAASAPKPIDVDLKLAGALGPETHVYGTTAVHLYQRDGDPGGSPPAGAVVKSDPGTGSAEVEG
jgi:16S rRNA (guanine(966)-N(2))-methyltransferase RsmD